jgi:hypothetical protein
MSTPDSVRITEIDVGSAARALAVLRWTDFFLVVACGTGIVMNAPELVQDVWAGHWGQTLALFLVLSVLAFAVHTGWRHVGVIDPRVWRAYLWVFPLLGGCALALLLIALAAVSASGWAVFKDPSSVLGLLVAGYTLLLALPSFVAVLILRRAKILALGVKVKDLIDGLTARGALPARRLALIPRAHLVRGILLATAGLIVLCVNLSLPLTTSNGQLSEFARASQQINLVAFVLLIRARRHFQLGADTLLGIDKRAPILFLRSFTDDERARYQNSSRALLDFSLETRLANHFNHFGPFIAIGSPTESLPQPGAARVLLPDDQWQPRILDWMKQASLIIMYGGTTKWVNWELRQVVESGRATSLILMFPEAKSRRAGRRAQDIAARVTQLREAFQNTPWSEELATFDDFTDARAMLFRPDGGMTIVRSRSRSREAYHLAALVAHDQLLDEGTARTSSLPASSKQRRVALVLGIVAAAAIVTLGIRLQSGSGLGRRLAFASGELYYRPPVTEVQAKQVGAELLTEGYFSNDHAVTVVLERQQQLFRLLMVIDPDKVDRSVGALRFARIGAEVSKAALADAPTQVILCNSKVEVLQTLPLMRTATSHSGDLYFSSPVGEREARDTGEALFKIGFLDDGPRRVSIFIERQQDLYRLRFVSNPGRLTESTPLAFEQIGAEISQLALGGAPMEVILCDPKLEPLRTLPTVGKLTFHKGQLYFTAPVAEREARAVGERLVELGVFTDDATTTVHLGREGETNHLTFVFDREIAVQRPIADALETISRLVAEQALDGQPITMTLRDTDYQPIVTRRIRPESDHTASRSGPR